MCRSSLTGAKAIVAHPNQPLLDPTGAAWSAAGLTSRSTPSRNSGGPWSRRKNADRDALPTDRAEFVLTHHPHGSLTADATEPAYNGYLLTVACPCGVTFERCITPEDAELDLLHLARLD